MLTFLMENDRLQSTLKLESTHLESTNRTLHLRLFHVSTRADLVTNLPFRRGHSSHKGFNPVEHFHMCNMKLQDYYRKSWLWKTCNQILQLIALKLCNVSCLGITPGTFMLV